LCGDNGGGRLQVSGGRANPNADRADQGTDVLSEALEATAVFLCLLGAAFAGWSSNTRLSSKNLQDDTNATVRLVANLFVVMTSLTIGLMMNSAKNSFDANDRNVRTLATDIILLDRTMRALGPSSDEPHRRLIEYVRVSLKNPSIVDEDPRAEALLDAVGTSLRSLRFSDRQQTALWNDARALYRQTVQQRWVVVEQPGGSIPTLLIVVLIGWLAIIFASFGYRAPRNAVVLTSFVSAAFLISATLFLILDMDTPATGFIKVSDGPIRHVLTELEH
jgi:hypothetical protein